MKTLSVLIASTIALTIGTAGHAFAGDQLLVDAIGDIYQGQISGPDIFGKYRLYWSGDNVCYGDMDYFEQYFDNQTEGKSFTWGGSGEMDGQAYGYWCGVDCCDYYTVDQESNQNYYLNFHCDQYCNGGGGGGGS